MNIQVYTANVGEHDPPRKEENGLKVFTEDLLGDPLLSARFYKTCPHLLFPEAEWTIWIDANVWLNIDPENLVTSSYDRNFGVFQHTWHEDVWMEGDAVLNRGFDTEERVRRTAMLWYKRGKLPNGQAMTMVLVRGNTPQNAARNAAWWQDICYGSRRDQLSFGLHYPGPYWDTVDFTKPNKYFTRVA